MDSAQRAWCFRCNTWAPLIFCRILEQPLRCNIAGVTCTDHSSMGKQKGVLGASFMVAGA